MYHLLRIYISIYGRDDRDKRPLRTGLRHPVDVRVRCERSRTSSCTRHVCRVCERSRMRYRRLGVCIHRVIKWVVWRRKWRVRRTQNLHKRHNFFILGLTYLNIDTDLPKRNLPKHNSNSYAGGYRKLQHHTGRFYKSPRTTNRLFSGILLSFEVRYYSWIYLKL